MRRWLPLLATIACGPGRITIQHRLAIGWEGTPSGGLLGPIDCDVSPTRLLERTGDSWRAARAGHEELPCKDGAIELVVAPVDHVTIAVEPALAVEAIGSPRLQAFDADGRELAIGKAPVEWTIGGVLERRSDGCAKHDDTSWLCGSLSSSDPATAYVRGTRAGTGELHATWAGHSASAQITVR
jgi:hypothetical protein